MERSELPKISQFLLAAALSLCAASPSYAGIIAIDFSAEVVNADGQFGPRGTVVDGRITLELTDLADSDPSPATAVFEEGQIASGGTLIPASEVGFGGNVTFSSGALNIENSGSARLTIENGPDGDRLSLFARNFRGFVEDGIVEFNFGFSGTNALFAGDLPLDQSLLALEDTLLNLDSSQLNQDLIGSITTFVGSRSFQSNTLDITSISVSALSVPEPGHLGVFALILLLVRNARVRSCSARVG